MTAPADKVLADDVHATAKALCSALNRAGEAGLRLAIELKPYANLNNGPNDVRQTNWHSHVSVARNVYL